MSTEPDPQRLYLHIGMPKTGTTYLQTVLFNNRARLKQQGLALVPHMRRSHFALVLAVQDRGRAADGTRVSEAPLRWATQLSGLQAPVGLFSHETMGSSDESQIDALMEGVPDHLEVHVVLTVRDLARQLSSSWQEQVKSRGLTSFADFVDGVAHGGATARGFWIARDLPAILDRWGRVAPPERTHVVVSPQSGQPPELLLDRFCSVLGIDPTRLDTSAARGNETLGHAQADLLRRVNLTLGDRLVDARGDYGEVGRRWFAKEVLARQASRRPLVPAELRAFVEEHTDTWLSVLRDGSYDVVGDRDELRPRDDSFALAGGRSELSDAELLAPAVAALADVLQLRHEAMQAAKDAARATRAPAVVKRVRMFDQLFRRGARNRPEPQDEG